MPDSPDMQPERPAAATWDAGILWDSLGNLEKLETWWTLHGQYRGIPRNPDGKVNFQGLAEECHIRRRQVFYPRGGNQEVIKRLAEYVALEEQSGARRATLTRMSEDTQGKALPPTEKDAMHDGAREILKKKQDEINVLTKRVGSLEGEVEALREENQRLMDEIARYRAEAFADELLETGRTDLPN